MSCIVKGLGGTMIVHDGERLDYCWREALASLLAYCEQVVVVDGESTDGTREALRIIALSEPRLSVLSRPWVPSPLGRWLSALTNEARLALKTPMHVNLQADEVLGDDVFEALTEHVMKEDSAHCFRYNFWGDAQHYTPPNRTCSTHIVRVAPTGMPSVDDAESLLSVLPPREPVVHIYHYGFIRRAAGFVAKSREVQHAFFGNVDPIVDEVEKVGMQVLTSPQWPTAVTAKELVTFTGTHPQRIHAWLRERGYTV